MKRFTAALIIIGCLLIAGAGGYYLTTNRGNGSSQGAVVATALGDSIPNDSSPSSTPPAISESTPATPEATQGMLKYQNTAYHFGLLFPDTLVATEYKENGGALTASFQDPNTNQGFEVYVAPYSEKQIDTARFKLDEPSGVREQPTDVTIDGTRATMFFGKNGLMGDTREVWFIKDGLLYEVTTYKELDTWLAGIMQTWKFI